MTKLVNHIEALLFLIGEPIEVRKLAKILNENESEIEKGIIELEKILKERGIRLLKKNKEVMLGTAPESSKYCAELAKEELNKNMGRAGLETLAIILYKEEVGKPDIDYFRGVNSAFTLRNLMIKGLVERKTNPQNKRSYVYSPTIQLFQYLGITKKEDLPNFEEFIKKIEDADQAN